jgi:hypothetical protein
MTAPIKSPLVLWANATTNQLHEGWQSTGIVEEIRLTQGDTVDIELHWLQNVTTQGYIHDEVIWPSAANITLALGLIDVEPTSGYFRMTYGSQTTGNLAAGISGLALQTALNALSTVAADGGVIVSKIGTSYKIIWNNNGVPTYSLTVGNNDLLPNSSVTVVTARAGTVDLQCIMQIHIKQAPVAAITTWENPPPVGDDMSLTYEGFRLDTYQPIKYYTWLLDVTDKPRNGTFNLTLVTTDPTKQGFTATVAVSSLTAESIADAMTLAGSAYASPHDVRVVQVTPTQYRISAWGSSLHGITMSLDAANVLGWSSKLGKLSLNTIEVETLLAGNASADCVMEIEVEFSGQRKTIIQAQVVIVNDLIDSDVYSLVEFGAVMPVESVVRYDTSQALGSGQQAQARTNIGALGVADLASTNASIASLQSQISSVVFSTDVIDALNGAVAASGTNVYLTKNAGDALYANTVHTHAIANVNMLQDILDDLDNNIGSVQIAVDSLTTSKANVYHTQAIGTITNLTTVLADYDARIAGFAPLFHTHAIADVVDLENRLATLELIKVLNIPTDDQAAGIAAAEAPDMANAFVTESRLQTVISTLGGSGLATQLWVSGEIATLTSNLPNDFASMGTQGFTSFSGNLTTTQYPYEIEIIQGGISYFVPART